QQQLTIYQAELTAAQTDLAAAQARLAAVGKKLSGDPAAAPGPLRDGDQKTLANTGAAIGAKRAALAAEADPADAAPIVAGLVADIAALLVTQRAQYGAVLDDLDEQSDAQAAADAASAAQARVNAKIADVQSAIASAKPDDDLRNALKDAIGKIPLNTLKA